MMPHIVSWGQDANNKIVRHSFLESARRLGFSAYNIPRFHSIRLLWHLGVGLLVHLLVLGLFLLLILVLNANRELIGDDFFDFGSRNWLEFFVVLPIALIGSWIFIAVIAKLASVITDRYFADSLCAADIILVLISLSDEAVLEHSDRKKALLRRTNLLARSTLLLGLRYNSQSPHVRDWAQEHFRQMETHIRERERWIIAPSTTTLADLRRDFYSMAEMYLASSYGEFTWQSETGIEDRLPRTTRQRIMTTLSRGLGLVIPLIILAILILWPEAIKTIGVEPGVMATITIAWLLLVLEQHLEFGRNH